jgi:hypothetical protein
MSGPVSSGPTGARLPKAVKPSEVQASFATVLVYSMPRWGKTNAIRTLVRQGFKVLIVATDQGDSMGLQTISDLPDSEVCIVPVSTWDEALLVFAELKKKRPSGKPEYEGFQADVMVNDSISGFGQIWMEKGLEVLGWSEVGVASPGHDPRQIYAYIPEKGRMTTKQLTNLPCHSIFLARETMLEEGEGKSRFSYPAPELPGAKLPRELPGWLDAVVFGKILNGHRILMTEAEGKVVAGIRAPEGRRFAKYIKGDYGLLIKAMMGDNAALEELTWKAPTPTSQPVSQPKEKK